MNNGWNNRTLNKVWDIPTAAKSFELEGAMCEEIEGAA